LRRKVEHRLGGLDSLLGLENGQEIKRADFNNPLAITNDDAFQDGRFLAQQDAPLVTDESVGLLDHFHCRAFAEIRLAKVRDGRARRVEGFIGLRRSDLDRRAARFRPVDDVLRSEPRGVVRRLVENRVGNDDVGVDEEQVVERLSRRR
jgi:hypothetical protein